MNTTVAMTNGSKKPYTAPKLVAFGDVRSITQNGSLDMMEATGMGNELRKA